MKLRNGFVSNSSSSSFVVAFPKKPKTVGETYDLMFPKGMTSISFSYMESISTIEAAQEVFGALERQKKALTKAEIKEEVLSGVFDGYPRDRNWGNDELWDKNANAVKEEFEKLFPGKNIYQDGENGEWYKKFRDAQRKDDAHWEEYVELHASQALNEFEKLSKGMKVYKFSYSDNEGAFFAAMEHGDVFRNLPHIRISHH